MVQNSTRRVDTTLVSWAASFFRNESGGFAAADRLTRLSEMAKDFINAVEVVNFQVVAV